MNTPGALVRALGEGGDPAANRPVRVDAVDLHDVVVRAREQVPRPVIVQEDARVRVTIVARREVHLGELRVNPDHLRGPQWQRVTVLLLSVQPGPVRLGDLGPPHACDGRRLLAQIVLVEQVLGRVHQWRLGAGRALADPVERIALLFTMLPP